MRIVAWCDGEHEEHEFATKERTVSLDGNRPVVLDLCDVHDKVFADLTALMERGAPADRVAALKSPSKKAEYADLTPFQRQPTMCPEPGCGYLAPTRPAANQHVRKMHHKKFADYPGMVRTGQHSKRGLTEHT